ncbi:MAG: hypothetical protein QOI20_2773 [Acidimicrobiaceae bacterium]|nr:hypothetical protein [Acidimicrobiaceae bacterium]
MASEPPNRVSRPGEVACGSDFHLPRAAHLRLEGHFPNTVGAGQNAVNGTVEVSADQAVKGMAAPAADAFLVRQGKVVTTPLPQDAMGVRFDLAAGETKSVEAMGSLVACGQASGHVPPGDYELYARFVLIPDDGEPATAFGGPWPLAVTAQ